MKGAEAFFEGLYGELKDGEFIEIRCAGGKTRQMFYKSPEAAAEAAKGLAEKGDVYFGVALRDGKGGKRRNIVRVPALWADLDDKPGLPPIVERLSRTKSCAPSAIVSSGKGLHLYWFLKESVGPDKIPLIEDLNKKIALWLGGDAVHDAPRILRVPETLNHKYQNPAKVRSYLLQPDRRYGIEHMCGLLGAGGKGGGEGGDGDAEKYVTPAVQNRNGRLEEAPHSGLPCRFKLWSGVLEGGRNNACFQLAVDLKREGMGEAEALRLLEKWNWEKNRPPMELSRLEKTVGSAYAGDYAGLGCDKPPMRELCSADCLVRRKAEDAVEASLWSMNEIINQELPPAEFVVDPLVPKMGVTLLTGEGGIGKSFILIELAKSVAFGKPFLDRFACLKGPVLMVDLENHDSVIARRARKLFAGWEDGSHMKDDIPIYGINKGKLDVAGLYIDTERGMELLTAALEKTRPVMLTIDPLVAVHSRDENDNVAMRAVIRQLQELARRYSMAVVVVHHPRKRGVINDAGQMVRGASDLRNAVDSHLFLRRVSKDRILIEQDKNRHAPEHDKMLIEMVDVKDGEAMVFRFAGEVTEFQEKSAEARECILDLLKETGKCRRMELVGRLQADGLMARTIDRALMALVEERQVCKTARGVYAIAEDGLPL